MVYTISYPLLRVIQHIHIHIPLIKLCEDTVTQRDSESQVLQGGDPKITAANNSNDTMYSYGLWMFIAIIAHSNGHSSHSII
jgi:hypothetical protein